MSDLLAETVPASNPVPPPIGPVLKEVAPTPPPDALPSIDAKRRAAAAIAEFDSEAIRREVRRQDAEMAGDLSVLLQKPIVKVVIGVLVAIVVIALRVYRVEYRAARFNREEPAPVAPPRVIPPTPPQPYAPPPTYAPPREPQYFTPATANRPNELANPNNLPVNSYRAVPGTVDPRRLPGMPVLPDPYSRLRRPGTVYDAPSQTTDAQVLDEAIRRLKVQEASEQQGNLPPQEPVQNPQVAPVAPTQEQPFQEQPQPPQNVPSDSTPQNFPPSTADTTGSSTDIPRF